MGHLIKRIIVVLFGFFVAALAASAIVVFAVQGMPRGEVEWGTGLIYSAAIIAMLFFTVQTMAPALIVAAIAEAFALRQWWFYLTIGLMGGLLADSLLNLQDLFDETRPAPVLVAAGCAAGLVYWLLAGRKAGISREGSFL